MQTACSLVHAGTKHMMLRWAYVNLLLESCIVQLGLLQLGYALSQLTQVRLICTSQIAASILLDRRLVQRLLPGCSPQAGRRGVHASVTRGA